MRKREVLSLLERFPDLVDSDELIQDLFSEAACEGDASKTAELERRLRTDRAVATNLAPGDEAGGKFSPRPR